jgi:UDP-3-O-[3-hydroxymyristoyl] N-acetylglucosamine deacetylase / 3-hydroxyacyl-[acyl-carrier-protein] dehydratase
MVRQQRTIGKEFVIQGQGLHTGNQVTMRVKPAAAGAGIKFVRVDVNPAVEIPAVVTSIPESVSTYRNTTSANGGVEIHTVEHILATCYGLQIDNLVIEMDGNEPPEPPSGTYASYATAFEDAGIVSQGAPADVLSIDRAVTLKENGIEINAMPAEDFRVSFTIQYDNPQIGTQYASFTVSPGVFEKEIAPARTFVMYDDVERLRNMGLIKGGTLKSALVFTREGVMNEESLRFPDECVRHKILDLIGDLSLLGAPIRGHVHAIRSGHAANVRFVRKLHELHQQKKRASAPAATGVWDIGLIQEMMPHRYPFLLVDRILELEDRKRVVGIKNVTINEHFFTGHFPGHPIMPAVLIIEAMAQTGGVMLLNTVDDPRKYLVYFTRVDKAKFRRPVVPGDQLRFELEMKSLRRGMCTMQGFAYVDGALAAEAELSSVIVER